MSIYVCSDIHGCYSKYLKLLSKINLKAADKLYILGDVIDREVDGLKIIEDIRSKDNIYLLKGNHEQLMIDYYRGEEDYNIWFNNGGLFTHKALQEKDTYYTEDLLEYLEQLPTM